MQQENAVKVNQEKLKWQEPSFELLSDPESGINLRSTETLLGSAAPS